MLDHRHSLATLTTTMASLPVPLGSLGTTKSIPLWYLAGRDAEQRVRSYQGKSEHVSLLYLEEWLVCTVGAGQWEGCSAGQHLWVLSVPRRAAPPHLLHPRASIR